MNLRDFFGKIDRITTYKGRSEPRVVIEVHEPGSIGGTPFVEVEQVYSGIDWNAGKVLLKPAQPLTKLTREEVDAISKSVAEGQSWHAYQQYKEHKTVADAASELLRAMEECDRDFEPDRTRLRLAATTLKVALEAAK
jgi:hypothetical protein